MINDITFLNLINTINKSGARKAFRVGEKLNIYL